ncbi:MAG: DNA repair protein RecO [Actinomycetota bacterium]
MSGQGIGLYRAQGIVLRAIKLGEADRIVTFYTQAHGRVRAVAKGARKSKSRFGGRLDAFTHVDLQLYRGRSDLDIVTQADIITSPRRLREHYASFCGASAMADAVERTTLERDHNVRVFLLFKAALEALERGAADEPLLAYAFLAKLSSMTGLHPTLHICVDCGSQERAAFSYGRGGAVCGACIDRADPKTTDSILDAWAMLLNTEWDTLRESALDADVSRDLGSLLLTFVQWHTETRFKAFAFLPASVRGAV